MNLFVPAIVGAALLLKGDSATESAAQPPMNVDAFFAPLNKAWEWLTGKAPSDETGADSGSEPKGETGTAPQPMSGTDTLHIVLALGALGALAWMYRKRA